ncbi:MAG: hypothetical protein IK109_11125 [Clostridiales bacterium]|nr:hypothetical protein [Clostridiales bacterium]
MSKFASEHSTWLKEYCKRVKKAKAKSNGNKKIIPIIIFLMAGGLDAYLIFAKDGLNDPQLQGPVKGIAIGAGIMLLLSILLIALGKKKDVTIRTTSNLDELLTSVEAVKDFDEQMKAAPFFKVEIDANACFFATKDYLVEKFPDLGNETYSFVRLSDIAEFHYCGIKKNGKVQSIAFDIRDRSGNVIMNGILDSMRKVNALSDGISQCVREILIKED